METRLSPKEIEDYLANHGKQAQKVLSFLGKNIAYVSDLGSPLTSRIIDMLISDHEYLITRLTNLEATDEEKVRYRVVKELLSRISNIIEAYKSQVEEVRKGSKKGEM